MKRVLGNRCECGQPALSTGRCRSCAARLANRTRKLVALAAAQDAYDRARERAQEKRREYETAYQSYRAAQDAVDAAFDQVRGLLGSAP